VLLDTAYLNRNEELSIGIQFRLQRDIDARVNCLLGRNGPSRSLGTIQLNNQIGVRLIGLVGGLQRQFYMLPARQIVGHCVVCGVL
jgi:hypothetical protein